MTTRLKEVSLKTKIGQMLIMGFKGIALNSNAPIVKSILAQRIGGVILFDYDLKTKTYNQNINSPQQLKRLTDDLQNFANQAAAHHGNTLSSLLVSIDYEGGKVNRLKEKYGFPKALSAAEIGLLSLEEAYQYAEQMALTLKDAGINLNFAPVVDINLNPDNPVIGKLQRSFSNDAQTVIQYANVFSKAYQTHGITCVYKHFPGHGSSTGDTHEGFVDITQTWQDLEIQPYQQLLHTVFSSPMVMTAHVVHYGLDRQGYPASLSYAMTQTLLREKLGFNGIVITDDLQMKAISDQYDRAEVLQLAINAGADMLIFGNQWVDQPDDPEHIVDLIYHDVISGKISENRIDEAYQRIAQLKEKIKNRWIVTA